jgi:hypothetical protein
MDSPIQLTLTESKSKDLVPVLNGKPLHSLHNPSREAEVFASNHLAQLSQRPNVLVLGLGFGYHLEEMAKILRLRHKEGRIVVVEPCKELFRLWSSYRPNKGNVEVFCVPAARDLYNDRALCQFLLLKPVVIIHGPSYELAKPYYQEFLQKRAAASLSEWRTSSPWWNDWAQEQVNARTEELLESRVPQAAWLRAFWEMKHAE